MDDIQRAEAEARLKESDATRRAVSAWVVEGIQPDFHRSMKDQLRRDWPMLARALDDLTQQMLNPTLSP